MLSFNRCRINAIFVLNHAFDRGIQIQDRAPRRFLRHTVRFGLISIGETSDLALRDRRYGVADLGRIR